MDAILNILPYLFWFALALSILVFVHELGHFLAARLFGMRVDAFSIGFPPVIIRKKVGDTEYRLGAVPLGGYVKIAGMVDESLDASFAQSEPAPDEFRAKPVWQRMVVISGGVVFNLILAFLVFIGLALAYGEAYVPAENVRGVHVEPGSIAAEMGLRTGDRIVGVNGEPLERFDDLYRIENLAADRLTLDVERGAQRLTLTGPERLTARLNQGEGLGIEILPAVVGAVQPGSPAEEAGLRAGDRIVAIDGRPVRFWTEMTGAIRNSDGAPLQLQWARPVTNVTAEDPPPFTRRDGWAYYQGPATPRAAGEQGYLLGIGNDAGALGVRYTDYSLGEAIAAGTHNAWALTSTYVSLFGRLFTGRENLRDNVGGPLMIAKATKEAADQGGRRFWEMVAMLSIALAVFNVLPIPVLDGGHLVFLLYEGITRREPSLKVRMAVQQVGMLLLLAFMVFVIFNDAVRWFG
ncbi:MAG TPA: RIP metalloprotease RseP [Rubricoccaceae bacterium]|nr:RIP metalloprotease RseP [Rubricoccaceae bacterium]